MTERRCKECQRALPAAPRIGRPPALCEDCSHPLKDCEACGQEFRGRPGARYCSKQCASRAASRPRPEPIWVPCAECGTPFHPRPNQRYCDPVCRERAAVRRAPAPPPPPHRPNRLCYGCRKPFYAEGNQRYCSPECTRPTPRRSKTCAECGRTFHPRGPQRYCTKRCKGQHYARRLWNAHPGDDGRLETLARLQGPYKCGECDLTTNAGNLGKHQLRTGHTGREEIAE